MKRQAISIRDIVLFVTMIGITLVLILLPKAKYTPSEKINLSGYLPESFGDWTSEVVDMSAYVDPFQSINELITRVYTNSATKERVILIVEYGSDLRRSFAFHFPEVCHRAGGNEVVYLDPLNINLSNNKSLKAKALFIKGMKEAMSSADKMLAYWLVIDNKQRYTTFSIKLDQMIAGLLSRPKKGFLFRVDTPDGFQYKRESIELGRTLIAKFIKDMYQALDNNKKEMFFGT
jgi:EpsI family protein